MLKEWSAVAKLQMQTSALLVNHSQLDRFLDGWLLFWPFFNMPLLPAQLGSTCFEVAAGVKFHAPGPEPGTSC